jgi:hypothetical protein
MFLLKACNPERFRQRLETINVEEIDPDKLTPAQLDKIGEHLIRMAGIDEAKVAEAKRRLAAGEDVTVVDAVCRDVTED